MCRGAHRDVDLEGALVRDGQGWYARDENIQVGLNREELLLDNASLQAGQARPCSTAKLMISQVPSQPHQE